VNAKLGKHRDEIEQLNNVRGLLKKLQSVFDLPARLRACLELGSLASAVREYAAAAPLLERFGTGAFASVARDVSGTVKEIGDKLRATLRDPATRPDDAAEALELLQMLRLPQDELQREWLSERRKALSDAIGAAKQAWAAVGTTASTTNDAANWLSGLNAAYLAELMQTVKSYREVRASPRVPRVTPRLTRRRSQLFPESRTALVELCKATFADYFALVKAVIAPATNQHAGPIVSGKHLMTALARLAADLAGTARLVPELRLNDRAAEVVELAVRRHVCCMFARVEERTAAGLKKALADLEVAPDSADSYASLLRLQTQIGAEIAEGLSTGLRDVDALQDEHSALLAAWKEVFDDLVQGQCQLLFTGLAATFIALTGLPPMPEAKSLMTLQQAAPEAPAVPPAAPAVLPPAVFMLFLMRLCSFLEEQTVPAVAARLSSVFQEGQSPTFNAAAVQRLLRTAAARLLIGYAQQQGRKLSKLVRRSMATPDWLSLPEPSDVRPVCDTILSELAVMEAQVAHLLPLETGAARAGPAAAQGATHDAKISRNVAKLFQEKLRIFDEIEATRAAVMLGVVKIALKSWVECVRLVTLGRCGFHQLQLDAHHMRSPLRAYASSSPGVVDSLLDEVVAAAGDRCVDAPVSLDSVALDTRLAGKAHPHV
jgi:hypothetical protein